MKATWPSAKKTTFLHLKGRYYFICVLGNAFLFSVLKVALYCFANPEVDFLFTVDTGM